MVHRQLNTQHKQTRQASTFFLNTEDMPPRLETCAENPADFRDIREAYFWMTDLAFW